MYKRMFLMVILIIITTPMIWYKRLLNVLYRPITVYARWRINTMRRWHLVDENDNVIRSQVTE